MKKWLLLLATSLVLVGCGETATVDTTESTESIATTTDSELAVVDISVTVDGEVIADGAQEVEVEEGALLLDVMKEYYEIEEADGFVSAINGHEQDTEAGKYWLYDVNGEMAEVGAAELELADGDLVEWKLEAFEE